MNKKLAILTSSIALFTALSGSALAAGPDLKSHNKVSIQTSYTAFNSQESENLKLQVSLLEQVLAPTSAKSAADQWAKALSSRNGAYQYALFTKSLKQSTKAYFDQNGWVTGGSSPWVKSYKVLKEKKLSHSAFQYTFEFSLATSSGNHGKETATIDVKQVNKNWFVDKVTVRSGSVISFRTPYANEATFTYRAAVYAFSIPVSWDTKYTASEKDGSLIFKYKPKNSAVSARTLFSIDKISEKTWEKDGYADGLYVKLASKDGFVYAMNPASENQYADRPNSIEYNEFHQMSLKLKQVAASFQLGHQ
ncbi:hypothetical protein CVD28_26450 [Bacillus sp. M6-12]|uniref:hypothetical protein n=1 Tax=Bacillus sp. M6-12 TaxID=2054166 RepID=UPI000C78A7D1|nr:hypothetical protein [Bacillus sp. M6-12]PLS14717.1 hypothetical protein CVD28_26450 [Bacillus sp. M6-12]